MSEIVTIPQDYQKSDILNKISLPKENYNVQKTLEESRKLQKNISSIEDSEEKRRKKNQIQKEK